MSASRDGKMPVADPIQLELRMRSVAHELLHNIIPPDTDMEETDAVEQAMQGILNHLRATGNIRSSIVVRTQTIQNQAVLKNGETQIQKMDSSSCTESALDMGMTVFERCQYKKLFPAVGSFLMSMKVAGTDGFDVAKHFAYMSSRSSVDRRHVPFAFLECGDGDFNLHFALSHTPCTHVRPEAAPPQPIKHGAMMSFMRRVSDKEDQKLVCRVVDQLFEMERCASLKLVIGDMRNGSGTWVVRVCGFTSLDLDRLTDVLAIDGVKTVIVSMVREEESEHSIFSRVRLNVNVVMMSPSYAFGDVGKKRRNSDDESPHVDLKRVKTR